jgi:hypothetical protein
MINSKPVSGETGIKKITGRVVGQAHVSGITYE